MQPGNSTTYLHNLVPASRHDDRVLRAWTEANAAHPLRVTVLSNVELAVAKRVPQLDSTVTTSGHNLAVVGAKAHTENVASVTNKATRCLTRRYLSHEADKANWPSEEITTSDTK